MTYGNENLFRHWLTGSCPKSQETLHPPRRAGRPANEDSTDDSRLYRVLLQDSRINRIRGVQIRSEMDAPDSRFHLDSGEREVSTDT